MPDRDILETIELTVGSGNMLLNEPMSSHTTFRVGGMADAYVRVTDREMLKKLISLLKDKEISYYLIGNGSNILVSDEGYRGVVIELAGDFLSLTVEGDHIKAGSAVMLGQIASAALKSELAGMEFASGIPGTLGGALVMNAGAYGGEMKDIVESVELFDPESAEFFTVSGSDMEFGYRRSILKDKPCIALGAVIGLHHGDREEIKAIMDKLNASRREKQPLEYPSAGSTFKRPEGYYAGALIEKSSLKGFGYGDAVISEKHAGFLINRGQATATDIYRTIREVQRRVYEDSGVKLEPEVIMLGDFE
ncbi:MAG: UDP-N-acetylmuramate dehydrogenase [Lachnospiraceae bacterium]|nr:UDP-N-acetylmuramate dehydrogenase [Lachnospiraceae bacterium]